MKIKKIASLMVILICFLLLIGILAACAMTSNQMQGQTKQNETEESSGRTKATSDGTSPENKETMEQTGYTAAVPSSYKTASGHPGTMTRLDYDSKDLCQRRVSNHKNSLCLYALRL